MKPKYHAPPPSPAVLHRITTTITTITGGGISLPPYRLHFNLECREFSYPLSLSFPPFSLPIVERACCLPVKRQRIHPLLNQYCANLSATPTSPYPCSHLSLWYYPLLFLSPRFYHLGSSDMPPKKSIVYSPTSASSPSFPPFLVIDLCANIEPRRRGRERKWEKPDETA